MVKAQIFPSFLSIVCAQKETKEHEKIVMFLALKLKDVFVHCLDSDIVRRVRCDESIHYYSCLRHHCGEIVSCKKRPLMSNYWIFSTARKLFSFDLQMLKCVHVALFIQ